MTMKDSGGTISVTKYFGGYPITVTVYGDELDEKALPDAVHAALELVGSPIENVETVSCYLYSVLAQAFDVVSVEVQDGNREGQV